VNAQLLADSFQLFADLFQLSRDWVCGFFGVRCQVPFKLSQSIGDLRGPSAAWIVAETSDLIGQPLRLICGSLRLICGSLCLVDRTLRFVVVLGPVRIRLAPALTGRCLIARDRRMTWPDQ
jgi:hypothetical protein